MPSVPRYLTSASAKGEWPSAPSEAVSPGAAEKANRMPSARPMRPSPGLTSWSGAMATTPRPSLACGRGIAGAPNGSLRQASRMMSPVFAISLTASRTSSSGKVDAFSASSDDASASIGSSRLSPEISTPCPAKIDQRHVGARAVIAKIVERAAHALEVAVGLQRHLEAELLQRIADGFRIVHRIVELADRLVAVLADHQRNAPLGQRRAGDEHEAHGEENAQQQFSPSPTTPCRGGGRPPRRPSQGD